jgi:hypothetical protein
MLRGPRDHRLSWTVCAALLVLAATVATATDYTITVINATDKDWNPQCSFKLKTGKTGQDHYLVDFTLAPYSGSGAKPQYVCKLSLGDYCPGDLGGYHHDSSGYTWTTRQCMSGVSGTGSDCPAPGYVCENSTWELQYFAGQYQWVRKQ